MASTLNDIPPSEYTKLVEKYGEPQLLEFAADFLEFECELVRRSTRKGRNHDITCFIRDNGCYVVIQKHAYADTGIYRAPSGGANSGEGLEVAAKREMLEETGLEIELVRFMLDMRLEVRCTDETIQWRSLVFLADKIGGEMDPLDTYEIYDVKQMSRSEIMGDVQKLMMNSGWGGFEYRAFLTEAFFTRLDELKL